MQPTTFYTITEQDARTFLRQLPPSRKAGRFARNAATVVLIAGALFAGNALFSPRTTVESASSQVTPPSSVQAVRPHADQAEAPATPAPTPTPLSVTLPNNTVSLASINVSAPIIWNVPLQDGPMNSNLEKGVIHIAGTALPGQQGMVTIAGHSSNYAWAKGDYNNIFAPLPKVKLDQAIELNYNGVQYQYKISKIYEVGPDDVQILSDNSKTGLRLITCTPVGTSLRRLVVEAVQIGPDASANAQFTPGTVTGQLPGDS